MGDICQNLAKGYGVSGAIGAIASAAIWGKLGDERSWLLTIAIFIGVGFSVAMVTAALYTLGDIYNKVYSIGNVANDVARRMADLGKEGEEKKKLANGGWKCPNCSKINYSYESTCKCGRSKWDK